MEDSISISLPTESGKTSFSSKRETWESVQKLPAVWLRVTSQVWSPNLEHRRNDRSRLTFGHRLQKRWKKIGLLWLDDIWSAPILLDLKKLVII